MKIITPNTVCVSLVYKCDKLYFSCIFQYVTFTLPENPSPFCTNTSVLSLVFVYTYVSGTSKLACIACKYSVTLSETFFKGLHSFNPTNFNFRDKC